MRRGPAVGIAQKPASPGQSRCRSAAFRASLSFARSRTSSFLPPSVTRRNAHCGSGSVLRPAARWASTALSGRSVESGCGGHSPAHLGDGGHGGGDGDASRGGGGGDGDGRTGRYLRHSGGTAAARAASTSRPPTPSCCGGRTRRRAVDGDGRGRRQRPPHRDRRRPHDRRRRREQRRLRPLREVAVVDARPAVARDDEAVGRREARLDVEHVLRPARREDGERRGEQGSCCHLALANSAE